MAGSLAPRVLVSGRSTPMTWRSSVSTGALTVVITHNEVIAGMADRVIRLSDGRVISQERNATRKPASGLRW